MSSKKTALAADLSTEIRPSDERADPRLRGQDEFGRELVSDVSLSVNAYYPTLGERIRRYMVSPVMQNDVFNDPEYWDDEEHDVVFGDQDVPRISVHEERYKEGVKLAKERKNKRDEEEKESLKKKAREELLSLRDRMEKLKAEVQEDIDIKKESV